MKRSIALFLAIMMLFSLCACAKTQSDGTTELTSNESMETTEPALTEPALTEPAPTEPAPTEPTPTEPAPTEPAPTEPAPTEPIHEHSFSAPTCTEAGICSCGATGADALGHSWQASTCLSPKTCTVCGATEGGLSEHSFSGGVCSVCGKTDTLAPKENIKIDAEYVSTDYIDAGQGEIYAGGISIHTEGGGDEYPIYALLLSATFSNAPEDGPGGRPAVQFNGKSYYRIGAGMTPHVIEFTDTEIIVKNSFYEEYNGTPTLKLIMLGNGDLKVTHSTNSDYKVGAILSISTNGLK